jgi:hypothetical protein
MITCRLKGGLGNQMFQIAAASALALELDTDAIFDFGSCHTPAQGFKSNKYKETIFKGIKDQPIEHLKLNGVYTEPKFSYTEISKNDNIILNGYFQSEKYFIKYKNEIKNIFHFDKDKEIEIKKYLSNFEMVTAIHVRRGDYLKLSKHHPVCTIEYYKKAMQTIGKDNDFIFISDDINWCKENFKGKNIHYSPFTDELDDLHLIKLCDNQIIANSSFSWWGAYLCTYHNNEVIAPEIWFGPKGPQDTQDIIPNNWVKI